MNTYKLKSGIFLLAFVASAVLYNYYEQQKTELQPLPVEDTVVDLEVENDEVDEEETAFPLD